MKFTYKKLITIMLIGASACALALLKPSAKISTFTATTDSSHAYTTATSTCNKQLWLSAYQEAQKLAEDPEMVAFYQLQLAQYGNTPASAEVTNFIHAILRETDCPVKNVPVYKYNNSGGLTGGFCIWIGEDNIDKTYLKYVCAHEAGHWYHLHSWPSLGIDKTHCEVEADEFALRHLTPDERATIIARAHHTLSPKAFTGDSTIQETLKPDIIDGKISMICPTSLYAKNIVGLSKQFPELA